MRRLALSSLLTASAIALAACGGSESTPPPVVVVTPPPPPVSGGDNPPPIPASFLETTAETAEFLIQAGLGPNQADIDAAFGKYASEWLTAEFDKPATLTLSVMQSRYNIQSEANREHTVLLWQNFFEADDVLRQRMMYALSQIFVVSDLEFPVAGFTMAHYSDILTNRAFGNYRDLLEDITYSPAMAQYLTYLGNQKGDPATGRMPDENYAREILQLFSIGLVELNMDGTPKLDINGKQIPTYSNEDIVGLAKVFTGIYPAGLSEHVSDRNADWEYTRLQSFDSQHSQLEKSFLGTTIAPNTLAQPSITHALDTIFNHPNVAPYLSRQLIQRFTASNPAPAYVQRVAQAFETGIYMSDDGVSFGAGVRGDLKATLAAVLLDETVHDGESGPMDGKVREPVLKFIQFIRTFSASPTNVFDDVNYESPLIDSRSTGRLAQHPLRSSSVFNFYRPGYVQPGSESGDAGMTAPEFQIVNEASSMGYVNFMNRFIMYRPIAMPPGFKLIADFSPEIALADNPKALVDHLNIKLTGGTMSEDTIADIKAAVELLTIRADPDDAAIDRRERAHLAVQMTVSSGAYFVLR